MKLKILFRVGELGLDFGFKIGWKETAVFPFWLRKGPFSFL